MSSLNKVMLIGHLGQDPETRYTSQGTEVCTLSIATNSSWKDKTTGELHQATEWHRVVGFDKLALTAKEYLRKGRTVYVEGQLKTQKWQDKQTGQERQTVVIHANNIQFLDKGSEQLEASS